MSVGSENSWGTVVRVPLRGRRENFPGVVRQMREASEIQVKGLEHVSLSPETAGYGKKVKMEDMFSQGWRSSGMNR